MSTGFYDDLERFVRRDDLIQHFRLTNKGIFLQQDAFEVLFSAYQAWQQKVREDADILTLEKIKKRLLGSDPLPLQYLIEGKRCFVGFLLPNSTPQAGFGKTIPHTGTLFDPSSYLDARDPIFLEHDSIRLRTTRETGVSILLKTKRAQFECSTDAVKRFAECCRNSPQLTKEFPETTQTLRGCLRPLQSMLERARSIAPNIPLLLPDDLVRGNYDYLEYRSVLIISQNGRLLQFYDRKGKGETQFLRSEISKLGGRDGEQGKVRGFSAAPEKSFHLGKLWFRGMSFLLHPDALKQYIRMLPKSGAKQKIPNRYSVLHVMQQLVPAFVRAQVLDDANVRKLPFRYRQANAKYRRFADSVFVITDKNVISQCFLYRSTGGKGREKPAKERTPPQGQESNV